MLDGIDEDAVDFRPTYDGEEQEPVVLPGGLPNLLANGSQGIAVGMATSIPPHNLAEICDALLHLIKFPKATVAKLVDLMPGPDFPTGGVLVESRESLVETYRTRPRLAAAARQMAGREAEGRDLAGRRRGDSLSGAEVAPDRAHRPAAAGAQARAARRRA